MHNKVVSVCVSILAAVVASHAAVIGFDQPAVGQIVTNTTFDNGWHASTNGDANPGAQTYWYGSPPSGPENVFEPDPGAISGYHGGAVWLDSAAVLDGQPILPNSGMTITKTVSDTAGLVQNLSFFLATEVTNPAELNNPKGNPGTCFLFVNGVMIKGNGADGAFESEGPNPQFSPGAWTKYDVSFIGTGSDVITFRDDESGTEGENLVEETNSVLADVSISQVPELTTLGMVGVALVSGTAFLRRRKVAA